MTAMLTSAGGLAYPFVQEGEKLAKTDILEIEKEYPDEWLWFEVYEVDKLGRPMKGRLLAHSPSRSALDEFMAKKAGVYDNTYRVYTGPKPKKGMAVVL